jgi:hypothetical protein
VGDECYRLVLIEWEDSHGVSSEWQVLSDDIKPHVLVCTSVGWLIYDGDDCKAIIPHLTHPPHGKQQGCGDMTIPSVAVRRVVDLCEVSETEARELTEALRDVKEGRTTPLSEVRKKLTEPSDGEPVN